eukprot:TRINITY_DN7925_c0_g1_i1.p1 TRINITY_DN7925_c0_g1~~TRINITY_DN7925_c0_g1_i1.p1  ORF type:complete len:469 (-),score=104.38 TRINITY_DN7925_c0_g1_i1:438-1844(-)
MSAVGHWNEETGEYEYGKGEYRALKGKEKGKGKGKGKDGKGKDGKGKGKFGKGKDDDSKRQKTEPEEPEEELPEFDFEKDWKDKRVTLLNLKGAKELNGLMGTVKEYNEETKRFTISVDGKGDKSLKMENIFKVMTGSLIKLRGLDSVELNDTIAECGKLDVETMRYDVILSDGRHIKVKPSNADFLAKYESTKVSGDKSQMDVIRSANGLRDRLQAVESFEYPVPQVIAASAMEEYSKKFPKSVVIGKSNASNPKGAQLLSREVTSSMKVPPGSRLVFVSMPRDKCVAPGLDAMRHDELLRLGKLGGWLVKRYAPRPVYFLLPGCVAKGPPSALASAACAFPLYVELCSDLVILESERWHKSPWTRLDGLLAVWAKTPIYILPEKYQPAIELPGATPVAKADADEDAKSSAAAEPLSFRAEEPFTISRPLEGLSNPSAVLQSLVERAAEAEPGAKVQKPALAVKRLG